MSAPVVKQFEAKLYALRKTKEGTIVQLLIHPHDDVSDLLNTHIGTDLDFAWTLGDPKPVEVEPIEVKGPLTRTKKIGPTARPLEGTNEPADIASEPGNRGTAGITLRRRMLAERVAILCADKRFLGWLSQTWGEPIHTPARADLVIKERLRIDSKTELNEGAPNFNAEAAANMELLIMTFQSHLLSEKYADVEHR